MFNTVSPGNKLVFLPPSSILDPLLEKSSEKTRKVAPTRLQWLAGLIQEPVSNWLFFLKSETPYVVSYNSARS